MRDLRACPFREGLYERLAAIVPIRIIEVELQWKAFSQKQGGFVMNKAGGDWWDSKRLLVSHLTDPICDGANAR